LCFSGYSTGQSPSGISGTGPLLGPPALNRSLGGCGVGDAVALLGGDALLVGGGVSGGGLVGGGVSGGGLVGDGVLGGEVVGDGVLGGGVVGGGVALVVVGGLVVGGGVVMVVEGGLLPSTPTGVSSLAGSSYGYTSQATPEVPSEAVPIGPSNPLGSLGSRLSSACASACESKLAQSNWSCANAGLLGLSIC
jgi:hypothetical protein